MTLGADSSSAPAGDNVRKLLLTHRLARADNTDQELELKDPATSAKVNMVSKICPFVSNDLKEPPSSFQHGKKTSVAVVFVDVLFTQFISTPLIISHWAYVWELAEATGSNLYSAGLCALIGFAILIVAGIFQFWLKRNAVSARGNAIPLVAKLYLVATSTASIISWRGVWAAMDLEFGTNAMSCCYSLALGIGLLMGMGALKTAAAAPPFLTMNDDVLRLGGALYDFPTRFNSKSAFGLTLDSMFSVIVPTVGVVGVWRALWIPQDLYIVLEDEPAEFRSNAISCITGWTSAFILLILQLPMEALCLFPDTPILHVKLTMSCVTLLLLLGLSICSNSAAKGCVCDGFGIGNFISFFSNFSETRKVAGESPMCPSLTA
ncbi:hypothetical protein BIW11_10879 [Tropilaelaps mercedesae]|uniref:Uncharacterized protein n=1 Tax=Tropilaelaps mercedesae TaxID=418985 RepID=A0A1V9XDS0_9ACAR|nr:hypothetical protein BIW11_10879 [Tropilaelaps mercedesae]